MEDYTRDTASLRNKVDALQEALSAAQTSKAERAERDHAALCEAKEEVARLHVAATEIQARLSEEIQRGNRLQLTCESVDGDAARIWREKEAYLKRLQVPKGFTSSLGGSLGWVWVFPRGCLARRGSGSFPPGVQGFSSEVRSGGKEVTRRNFFRGSSEAASRDGRGSSTLGY